MKNIFALFLIVGVSIHGLLARAADGNQFPTSGMTQAQIDLIMNRCDITKQTTPPYTKVQKDCLDKFLPIGNPTGSCTEFAREYKKYAEACAGNKVSLAECADKLNECQDELSGTGGDSAGSIGIQMMSMFGINADSVGQFSSSSCSTITSKDYHAELRNMESDTRNMEEQLERANEELARNQKDTLDERKKIAREAVELDEQKAKDKVERQKQEMEDGVAAQESFARMVENIDKLQADTIEATRQRDQLMMQKTKVLSALNNNYVKVVCTVEAKKKFSEQGQQRAGTISSLSGKAGNVKLAVKTIFQACVDKMILEREGERKSLESQIQAADARITGLNRQLQLSKESLKLMEANVAKAQQMRAEETANAEQSYLAKKKNFLQDLIDLQANFQTAQRNHSQKVSRLNKGIMAAKTNFYSSFSKPVSGATKTIADIQAEAENIRAFASSTNNCGFDPKTMQLRDTSSDKPAPGVN
jgi:hypothetical protein